MNELNQISQSKIKSVKESYNNIRGVMEQMRKDLEYIHKTVRKIKNNAEKKEKEKISKVQIHQINDNNNKEIVCYYLSHMNHYNLLIV